MTEQEQTALFKCWKCLKEFENADNLNIDYEQKEREWVCNDCQEKDFNEKYEIVTDRHDSEETALNVENYPYGWLRTTIRYYIETTKHGDRFVSQTLNPKTHKWNTPKKSTYRAVEVLTREKATGYTRTRGLSFSTDRGAILRFLNFIKGYELNTAQQEQIRVLGAYSKAYENVEFEIKAKDYEKDELTELLEKKEQNEVKESIKRSIAFHYNKNDFLQEQSI